jgi:hypothetical protein
VRDADAGTENHRGVPGVRCRLAARDKVEAALAERINDRGAAQSILKNLRGDLHGTYLASTFAALLGQKGEPLPRGITHRHLRMPNPACVGWSAWTEALSRLKASLDVGDNMGQPSRTERARSTNSRVKILFQVDLEKFADLVYCRVIRHDCMIGRTSHQPNGACKSSVDALMIRSCQR